MAGTAPGAETAGTVPGAGMAAADSCCRHRHPARVRPNPTRRPGNVSSCRAGKLHHHPSLETEPP
ncbi:hypothetical protein SERLA73DRAFT_173888 [Serpula lacrymans var. lacrymans S7.3]|uniref:Uncharacterized protein n=1 Tax=Serpula lacrymans var. lacrymans (strain S7.3) TaxID=936435 RepID=F8PI60_SERL3|nr:hypothetical protein SERLA73DRAFT_173888 [Serpula lacrymans var. lacrymans S7.3]